MSHKNLRNAYCNTHNRLQNRQNSQISRCWLVLNAQFLQAALYKSIVNVQAVIGERSTLHISKLTHSPSKTMMIYFEIMVHIDIDTYFPLNNFFNSRSLQP
uniref:Uncharacterized protein n=1 Tax=Octactis speculum TaxID=3111310 RepID=A0A6U3QR51_9STRA